MSEYQKGVNQLPNIIHMIQFSHQTGILAVERNSSGGREEGRILFINGQIQAANSGKYKNGDALSRLKNWGECRFQFVKQSEDEIKGILRTSQQEESNTGRTTTRQTTNGRTTNEYRESERYSITSTQMSTPSPQESVIQYPQTPVAHEPITQPSKKITLPGHSLRDTPETGKLQNITRQADIPDSTPQRSDKDSRIARMYFDQGKLSRTHRRIYLLVDGIHTCKEIARLTGRTHGEIIQYLQDLQQAGLIRT